MLFRLCKVSLRCEIAGSERAGLAMYALIACSCAAGSVSCASCCCVPFHRFEVG